jgi:two-component system response regulator YesN
MQIIYTILEKNGESAHRLFDDSTSEQSFEQACNSVETMKIWVCHVIDVFDACLSAISQSDSSIELIRKYIREHLDEDLNRKKLASLVYLSPDYLSHVFSERTGESLTAFILNERIKRAKELLLLSQKSIRDIALTSGFPNISYFSRQFKCVTGKTPQEYRKK